MHFVQNVRHLLVECVDQWLKSVRKGLGCRYPPIASKYVEYNPGVVKNFVDTNNVHYGALSISEESDSLNSPSVLEKRHLLSTHLFLDPSLARSSSAGFADAETITPHSVRKLLAEHFDVKATCECYFSTIHCWLSILSKKRIYQEMTSPLSHTRPDKSLLYICMELATQPYLKLSPSPRSKLYLAARQIHASMETRGIFTLEVLQAGLLVAVYELGHAIYQSAYLSVGACARYATALGVNQKINMGMTWPLTKL